MPRLSGANSKELVEMTTATITVESELEAAREELAAWERWAKRMDNPATVCIHLLRLLLKEKRS
jgi:hypothetical protein